MLTLDRAELERFRDVVAARFGLQYDDAKLEYLADVLRQRVDATHAPHASAYLEQLASPASTGERQALATQLTINETFFFRNADHFRALAGHVLPQRLQANARTRTLRILSAGCASGEEPYSLAMLVREALPDLAQWKIELVGVDLSSAMISRALEGRYSAWSLRATPDAMKERYFRASGKDFVLAPEVREMVEFREGNLVEPDPLLWPTERYDLIFCRNVIMYFTPEVMRAVVQRASQALVPGGFLFLGHAETLRGLSQAFHLCHTHDTFYYQKREERRPADPQSAGWAPAPTPPVDPGASWVDAIQRASRRIADLARPMSTGAVEHAPGEALTPSPDLGRVLEAMRAERFSDALAMLGELPPALAMDTDALLLRAALLINGGNRPEAEHACELLLARDELNAGAHYVMALCREHAGDLSGAIECDRTAIYLDAGFAMPHLHLGLMSRRTGDLDTARHAHEQALLLLGREDASRVLLFGGGFSRDALLALCRAELTTLGGPR